ncbi:hypothetical protein EE612_053187 [Oryza sativa]|nr:hypothetical protein EE612_053187 [Oryza sativa]
MSMAREHFCAYSWRRAWILVLVQASLAPLRALATK